MLRSDRILPLAAPVSAALALGACTVDAHEEGEPALAQQCAEAAAALEECSGGVPEGFFEACEHDPTPESVEIVEELAATECEEAPERGKADSWGERIFVSACTPVMYAGYLTQRQRNSGGQRLPAGDRDELRPFLGDVVDRATVYYDATITTEWEVAGREISYGSFRGQAFGDNIYIVDSYRPGNTSQLGLMAHELQHVVQYEEAGGLRQSLSNYCSETYRAGFSYSGNELEIEANEVQADVLDCVRRGRNCP